MRLVFMGEIEFRQVDQMVGSSTTVLCCNEGSMPPLHAAMRPDHERSNTGGYISRHGLTQI